MSTIENTGYCNNTTDLLGILPELQAYDRKRLVSNWQTYSGSVYRSDSVGYVAMLYKDGKELELENENYKKVISKQFKNVEENIFMKGETLLLIIVFVALFFLLFSEI